jgi:hypothetical protein
LKVSTLKYWIGRPWSKGSFTGGISSLAESADQYLFKTQKEPTEISQENLEDFQENNPVTPNLKTPASASQKAFNHFFDKDLINKEDMQYEMLKLNFTKEVEEFHKLISSKNFKIVPTINSTASFWIKNAIKFPLLSKLARLLINIKSSCACIERFFSICGFNSKKNRGNIGDDLFTCRCILRANIDILKELNNISY